MSDTNVEVQFGGDASGALSSMSQVRHALQGLINPVRGIYDNLGALAEAFAAAFAVDRVAEFAERYAELGEQIERTSAMLGVSTQQAQELGFIAKITGGDAKGLATAMERLQVGLEHAQNSTSQQAQALRALGLSAKDLLGVPLPEQMNRIADAISKFADGGNKTAIVMTLMGRSGAQMIPVLDQGRAGLDELRDSADKTGSVLSSQTVKALSNLQRSFVTLEFAVSGLAGTFAGEMAPALTRFDNDLAATIGNINIAIQTHTLWEREMLALATGARELGQAVANLGVIAKDVFTLNWGAIAADRAAGLDKVAQIQQEGDDKINAIAKAAMDSYKKLMAGNDSGGSLKPNAPAMDTNQTNELAAAQKTVEGQIKVWDEWLAKQKTIYDEDAKTFGITQDQKFALTMAATDKAYAAELALLQKEAQIGDLTVAQRAAINAKIEALEAKHGADIAKLNAQSVELMQKEWEGYFATVEGAFNSNLRGLLAGTTTWAQAMNKLIGDLIIKFIEGEEQKLAQHIATEIAETTATQEGATARAAAEAAGNNSSILVTIANAIKSIFASVGQTTAGVTAAVAPVAGPAAPAIGAAAGASTMATALSYIHAETGAWEVAGGPALLHPGEMVVPKPFADSLRENGGGGFGGGGDTNINISAVDAQSIRNLFQGNADIIGSIVQKYVKNNPTATRV